MESENKKQYKKEWYIKNREEIRKKRAEYYQKNKEKIKAKVNEYRKNNVDKIEVRKPLKNKRQREYFQENKEKIYEYKRNYSKKRYKEDVIYKLSIRMRNTVAKSIKCKYNRKKSKTTEILGCSFKELKLYLEKQFNNWMSWDNHGLYNGEVDYGWDIDHIIPISSAKTIEEAIKLSHYSNLQPLCSHINRDIKRHLTD